MLHSAWFLDALKDIAEFAKQEKIDGVLQGLSQALETYAAEAGVTVDQHEEVLKPLSADRTPAAPIRDMGPV